MKKTPFVAGLFLPVLTAAFAAAASVNAVIVGLWTITAQIAAGTLPE